jgi:CDP-diacylglycerol--serine O-phosphatidyltransferase
MKEPADEKLSGEAVTRPRRLGRSVFVLPSLFTVGNIFCGYYAILATMYGNFGQAAHAIGIAIILDMLDGRIARLTNSSTGFGLQLDSLADVISFGVAPALVAYGAGMDGLWDRAILIYFVACGVSRLARYNITAETLALGSDKVRYFEGTPIPSSLLLVIVIAIAAVNGAVGSHLWLGMTHIGPWQFHPLVLMFAVSGSLMISRTLHIPKL